MRVILSLFLVCCLSAPGFSNAAMPGMWQAGHGGRFVPLFQEDSIHFGKIQMHHELVMIDLYPGFAAVKGEYWMYNPTSEAITLRVGYPVNGRYQADLVENVMFNDLYQLKALVGSQPAAISKAGSDLATAPGMQADNWYYFSATFAPGQLTRITVYFLTNNSEATLGRGYGRDKGNAFAYILESGRAWAGRIERGDILVRLNNGLELDHFRGVYPLNALSGDDHHLRMSFTHLEPDSSHNLLFWYIPPADKSFSFASVAADAAGYYRALDAFPVQEFNDRGFRKIRKDDFSPHDSGLSWLWAVLIGVVLLGLAVLGGIIYLVYRLVKRRRKNRG